MKIAARILMLGAMISSPTLGAPYAGANCGYDVKAVSNGSGVLFSEDCRTAYVLPPVAGQVQIAALAKNSNLMFCSSYKEVRETDRSMSRSASRISKQIEQIVSSYEDDLEEITNLRKKLAPLKVRKNSSEEALRAEIRAKKELVGKIADAKSEFNDCMALASDGSDCDSYQEDIKNLQADLRGRISDVRKARDEAREAQDDYETVDEELSEIRGRYDEGLEPVLALQDRLTSIRNSMFDMYKQYAALEGATGQVTYTIKWDDLVGRYQKANKGLSLTWQKVPVKRSILSVTTKDPDSGLTTSIPALLWSRVPGGHQTGPGAIPVGSTPIGPIEPTAGALYDTGIGFSHSASSQVALSLPGACPYFPNGVETNIDTIEHDAFVAHAVGNAEYTYDIKARRRYDANYRMSSFISRIEKKSRKGGLFSAKTVHSIVEDSNSSDWFKIRFDSDASDFQYSEAEQNQIRREVKADLVDRALKAVAFPNGMSSTPPPRPAQPATAASRSAHFLYKNCWHHSYCRYSSWVLGTLGSAFGRSTAVSEFHKSNNVWVSEHVDGVKFFERSAVLTFTKPKT